MEDWKKTDDEDLDEEDILLRNKCRKMSDDELNSIVPVWATDVRKMELPVNHPMYSNRIFMQCNVDKLIKNSTNLYDVVFNKKFDGFWHDESRFAHTLERWLKKECVDPPMWDISQNNSFVPAKKEVMEKLQMQRKNSPNSALLNQYIVPMSKYHAT